MSWSFTWIVIITSCCVVRVGGQQPFLSKNWLKSADEREVMFEIANQSLRVRNVICQKGDQVIDHLSDQTDDDHHFLIILGSSPSYCLTCCSGSEATPERTASSQQATGEISSAFDSFIGYLFISCFVYAILRYLAAVWVCLLASIGCEDYASSSLCQESCFWGSLLTDKKMNTWPISLGVIFVVLCTGFAETLPIQPKRERLGSFATDVMSQVIGGQSSNCHLVAVGQSNDSSIFSQFIKTNNEVNAALVIDSIQVMSSGEEEEKSKLLQGLWGDSTTLCRILLVDLTHGDVNQIFGFLELSGLPLWPDTHILMVGGLEGKDMYLYHPCLQNSLFALYVYLPEVDLADSRNLPEEGVSQSRNRQQLYWRCLYCNDGEPQLIILPGPVQPLMPLLESLRAEQIKNLRGHELKLISMLRFPYMAFTRKEEEDGGWGTLVTPKDSVDVRMLDTFSSFLNFTYIVREPSDRSWGRRMSNGSWNGMVGPMQRGQADLSTIMAPTSSRLEAIYHERLYSADELTIISLKPRFQVDFLAILKPFTEDVWASIVVSVILWSIILWIMQIIWQKLIGKKTLSLGFTMFYGWRILLDDSPSYQPENSAGKTMAAWWLITCMIVQQAYRSSLMAHLIVLEKSKPIETFADLLNLKGWTWGTEPWMLTGAVGGYFRTTQDQVIREMFKNLETANIDENLDRVEQGGHSFIGWRNPLSVAISSRYLDENNNPFYISKNGFSLLADFGWGFRKGAPFRNKFRQLMNQMIESGIQSQWQRDVIRGRIRLQQQKHKRDLEGDKDEQSEPPSKTTDRNVVLDLSHMQVAFYIFCIGHASALLAFFSERIYKWASRLASPGSE